jgi:hypothetical protein
VHHPYRTAPFRPVPAFAGSCVPFTGTALETADPIQLLSPNPSPPALWVHETGLLDILVDRVRRFVGRSDHARSRPITSLSVRVVNQHLAIGTDVPQLEIGVAGRMAKASRPTATAVEGDLAEFQLYGQTLRTLGAACTDTCDVLTFAPTHVTPCESTCRDRAPSRARRI